MKSLEQLKKERIISENNKLNVAKKRLNTSCGIASVIRQKEQIDYSLSVLENIDEVIKMEVAHNANLLFEYISSETQYTIFIKMFYSRILQYIRFIEKSNIEDDKFNGEVINLINYFGFTKNDILKLVDFDSDKSLKDGFIDFINDYYECDIPSTSEWIDLDDETRDLCSDSELEILDIYDIYLQFRNGDYMINKFGSTYPMLYRNDMIEYFGDKLFDFNKSSVLRRIL